MSAEGEVRKNRRTRFTAAVNQQSDWSSENNDSGRDGLYVVEV